LQPGSPHSAAPVATDRLSVGPAANANEQYASEQSVSLLRAELDKVREELACLRKDLDDLWANFR
jgi:hypothetical protein